MRVRLLALLALSAAPAFAKPDVPLVPLPAEGGILPYGPRSPQPVGPDHPYYHAVRTAPIIGMPDKVGGILIRFAKKDELQDAYVAAFRRSGLLAEAGDTPRYTLGIQWMKLEAPQTIGFKSTAYATLLYTLRRDDTGEVVFFHDITTRNQTAGGNGDARVEGNARFALSTNIASALACITETGRGLKPADCRLEPAFTFHPRSTSFMFVPRFR